MSEIKKYVDPEALDRFNQLITIRYQGRFKYLGEFELNDDFTDFNVLAPAHVGDVFHAKAGTVDEITFGEMKIKAGDWFVVVNESRVDEDGTIFIYDDDLDHEAFYEGDVAVEKLGSQMDDVVDYGYYNALQPIAPYAYEAFYDDLNYPYAYENFDDVVASTGGCSAVRSGNMFGRNLDWIYNEQVDFVVHTSAKGGRFATLGLCGQISKLDREFVASKDYASEYVLMPFYCVDGINENGVFVSMNVMPNDATTPEEIEPDGEVYASICANMIPRYILDYCASADDAVACIKHHLKIHFSDKAREGGFLPHYLIGDVEKTYVVEYVGENIVATLLNNDSAVMTNFRIAGTTPNADGKYNTPENKTSGAPSTVNGLDLHAAGVERFNLAKTDIAAGLPMEDIMAKLYYTNTYKDATSPFWYSEYVGMAGTTIDSNPSDFSMVVDISKEMFANRSRDPESDYYGTWQSKHSCVYNVGVKTLSVRFQETATSYDFKIDDDSKSFIVTTELPTGDNIKETAIYELKNYEQKERRYFQMPADKIAAGWFVDGDGVHIVRTDPILYTYDEIAESLDAIVADLGLIEITEAEGDANSFVAYTEKGEKKAAYFPTFVKQPVVELYVYDAVNTEWKKFYPIDGVTNPVTVEYITQHVYDVITGKEEDPTVVMTYSEYSFYVITDAIEPTIYLHNRNIYTDKAILTVEELPTDNIIESSFYMLKKTKLAERKYYKLSAAQKAAGAVIDTSGITTYALPDTTTPIVTAYDQVAAQMPAFATTYGFEVVNTIDRDCFVSYKDNEGNYVAVCGPDFVDELEYEIYFYKNDEWNKIYPVEGGGIIDVDELPTADIKANCIYKLNKTVEVQNETNVEFYKVKNSECTVTDTGVSIGGEVRTYADIALDKEAAITDFECEAVASKALCDATCIVFYTLEDVNYADKALSFTPTYSEDVEYELYFYAEDKKEWIMTYPSAVEFEENDIDFNDPSVWYPEKQV